MYETISIMAGLSGLQETFVNDWLGPIFLLAVAIFSIIFIKDRAWMKLLSFLGIAVVVGIMIFFSDNIFNKDSGFMKSGGDLAETLNVVDSVSPVTAQVLE